jgi:hypothetical protein
MFDDELRSLATDLRTVAGDAVRATNLKAAPKCSKRLERLQIQFHGIVAKVLPACTDLNQHADRDAPSPSVRSSAEADLRRRADQGGLGCSQKYEELTQDSDTRQCRWWLLTCGLMQLRSVELSWRSS